MILLYFVQSDKLYKNLKNNLRNLLGTHHLGEGECVEVTPGSFYKEKCVWNPQGNDDDWYYGYCFAEM